MRHATALVVVLLCMLCACTKAPDAAQVIEKAEAGETLTDEDFKVLSDYVNSAMTSEEAKAMTEASNKALHEPSPETNAAMQQAVGKMEKAWPLLQKASLYMVAGGALRPINDGPLPEQETDAPAN